MDGLRCKVSARLDHGLIRLTLDWVDVNDNQVGESKLVEEFNLSVDRPGCAYLSRAVFVEGEAMPGTFWIDERGARHFFLSVEAGAVDLFGREAALVPGEA